MNKYLKATAACAVALFATSGAMAEGPKLTVGGFVDSKFSINDNDDQYTAGQGGVVNFDQRQDGEIHFNGSAELDNGLKIRARVELEAFTINDGADDLANFSNGASVAGAGGASGGDLIDESWLDISGSFGAIRLGSTDMAGKRMTTGHQATFFMNVGENTRFNISSIIEQPNRTTNVTTSIISQLDLNSDAESISYVTPRFAGFQLGAGWASTNFEDSGQLHTKGGGQGDLSDIYDVAINWVGKFQDVGISVAAGYTSGNTTTGNGSNNPEQWSLGGRVTFGGFAIGLSTQQNDCAIAGSALSDGCNAAESVDEEIYEAGIRYIAGPNAFSIVGAWAETEGSGSARAIAANGDESQVFSIAYRRTLGPGVMWHNTLHIANYDNGAAGAAANTSNDGFGITTGLLLRF